MSEWWLDQHGNNLLKGVEGDETNPPRLSDAYIVDFLRRNLRARESFNRLMPQMLEAEQERLRLLAIPATYVAWDHKAVEDNFQRKHNTTGIHVSGPRGGRPRR